MYGNQPNQLVSFPSILQLVLQNIRRVLICGGFPSCFFGRNNQMKLHVLLGENPESQRASILHRCCRIVHCKQLGVQCGVMSINFGAGNYGCTSQHSMIFFFLVNRKNNIELLKIVPIKPSLTKMESCETSYEMSFSFHHQLTNQPTTKRRTNSFLSLIHFFTFFTFHFISFCPIVFSSNFNLYEKGFSTLEEGQKSVFIPSKLVHKHIQTHTTRSH
jgi:hypothetical protein